MGYKTKIVAVGNNCFLPSLLNILIDNKSVQECCLSRLGAFDCTLIIKWLNGTLNDWFTRFLPKGAFTGNKDLCVVKDCDKDFWFHNGLVNFYYEDSLKNVESDTYYIYRLSANDSSSTLSQLKTAVENSCLDFDNFIFICKQDWAVKIPGEFKNIIIINNWMTATDTILDEYTESTKNHITELIAKIVEICSVKGIKTNVADSIELFSLMVSDTKVGFNNILEWKK